MKFTDDLKELTFKRSHAEPCVFRTLNAGEIVAILLTLTTMSKMMESFA